MLGLFRLIKTPTPEPYLAPQSVVLGLYPPDNASTSSLPGWINLLSATSSNISSLAVGGVSQAVSVVNSGGKKKYIYIPF